MIRSFIKSRSATLTFFAFISLLIAASGQPDRFWLFGFSSYVIGYSSFVYILLQIKERKKWTLAAFFWFFCLQFMQNSWISTTQYHGYMIVVLHVLVSGIFAAQFACMIFLFLHRKRQIVLKALAMASFWTILEWSRLYLFSGYPFNPLGHLMAFHPISMQLGTIFGVFGLSFYVMFTSLFAAFSWEKKGSLKLVVMIWAFPFLFGACHILWHDKQNRVDQFLSVGLMQTGLRIEEKWEIEGREKSYIPPLEQWTRIFSFLNDAKTVSSDLLVFPEVAVPHEAYDAVYPLEEVVLRFSLHHELLPPLAAPLAEKNEKNGWLVSNAWIFQAIANQWKTEIIAGMIDSDDEDHSYNAAFYFTPFSCTQERYDKRALVPLTEYLPFTFLQSLMARFGITSFFTEGREAKVFYGKVPLGVSICFDEGFGGMIHEERKKGAKVLVNISNDEWFPQSRLSKEHFHLGRMRAIENGLPALRCCNTGVTGMIDSLGRIQFLMDGYDKTGKPISGLGIVSLPLYSYTTLFASLGNLPILSLSAFFLFIYVYREKVRKKLH